MTGRISPVPNTRFKEPLVSTSVDRNARSFNSNIFDTFVIEHRWLFKLPSVIH